jgi:hypothetical protein
LQGQVISRPGAGEVGERLKAPHSKYSLISESQFNLTANCVAYETLAHSAIARFGIWSMEFI